MIGEAGTTQTAAALPNRHAKQSILDEPMGLTPAEAIAKEAFARQRAAVNPVASERETGEQLRGPRWNSAAIEKERWGETNARPGFCNAVASGDTAFVR